MSFTEPPQFKIDLPIDGPSAISDSSRPRTHRSMTNLGSGASSAHSSNADFMIVSDDELNSDLPPSYEEATKKSKKQKSKKKLERPASANSIAPRILIGSMSGINGKGPLTLNTKETMNGELSVLNQRGQTVYHFGGTSVGHGVFFKMTLQRDGQNGPLVCEILRIAETKSFLLVDPSRRLKCMTVAFVQGLMSEKVFSDQIRFILLAQILNRRWKRVCLEG